MVRSSLVALIATLALPTAAAQASVKVTWPAQRTYAPGETVAVSVKASTPVRVALVRESASGKVMRTLAKRTLRAGTFSAAVPAAGHYALRVAERSRGLTVVAPAPAAAPTPNPAPTSGLLPKAPCQGLPTGGMEIHLGATAVAAGGSLPYDLVNVGPDCVTVSSAFALLRVLPDGTTEPLTLPYAFPAVGIVLSPGKAIPKAAVIPADTTPGAYRLIDENVAADFVVTD